MPIQSKKPFVDADGNEFPFLAVNLIVRPMLTPNAKNYEAPTVLNLLPFRVLPDGTIIEAPQSAMRSVLMRDAYSEAARDSTVAAALETIFGGIAQFVANKGL